MNMLDLMWQDAIAIARRTGGRPGALPKTAESYFPQKGEAPTGNKARAINSRSVVLKVLSDHDGASGKQIASMLGKEQATVSLILKKMRDEGLVTVRRHNGGNATQRAKTEVHITDAGRAWLEAQG